MSGFFFNPLIPFGPEASNDNRSGVDCPLAGLLQDWTVDGYGLSWIFATGFQRNRLTLFNYGFRPLTLNQ
jgi:hypothetical protein